MSDLISRSKLQLAIKRSPAIMDKGKHYVRLDAVLGKLLVAPAVDAVPVVHARWVHEQRYGDSGGWVWRCTACRRESITPIIFAMKYCNACGAKMDEKGDEESE